MATPRLLETVAIGVPPAVPASRAWMRTGVGWVPELTRAETRPRASEVCTKGLAEAGSTDSTPRPSIVTPPAPVCRRSSTPRPGRGLPAASRTSKLTTDDSVKPEPLR